MTKLQLWFSKHIWPWSALRGLRLRVDILQDRSHQADQFCAAVDAVTTRQQREKIWNEYHRQGEAECARIGAAAHEGQPPPVFPPKGTGKIDPKLVSTDFILTPVCPISPAARAVLLVMGDKTLPKLADLQRDLAEADASELLFGGPTVDGEFRVRAQDNQKGTD
jgi:hypothetical protein